MQDSFGQDNRELEIIDEDSWEDSDQEQTP
jgi:hypothetical protein